MKIETEYILGIADATLDMWQDVNGTIEAEKNVNFYAEPIHNKEKVIGCKLYINYSINNDEFDDKTQWMNIYPKDKIGGVISDISDILSSIDSSYNFNEKIEEEW